MLLVSARQSSAAVDPGYRCTGSSPEAAIGSGYPLLSQVGCYIQTGPGGRGRAPKNRHRDGAVRATHRGCAPNNRHRGGAVYTSHRGRAPKNRHRGGAVYTTHRGRAPNNRHRHGAVYTTHRGRAPNNRPPEWRGLHNTDIVIVNTSGPRAQQQVSL